MKERKHPSTRSLPESTCLSLPYTERLGPAEVLDVGHPSSSLRHRPRFMKEGPRQQLNDWRLQHSETWQDQECWLTSELGFSQNILLLLFFFLRGGSAFGFKVAVTTVTSRDAVNFRVKSELYLRGMCHVKDFTLITREVTYLVDLFPYAGENWERRRKQVWRPVLTRSKEFILDSWKLGIFLISFFSISISVGGLR